MSRLRYFLPFLLTLLVAASCGSSDGPSAGTTVAPATTEAPATTSAPTTAPEPVATTAPATTSPATSTPEISAAGGVSAPEFRDLVLGWMSGEGEMSLEQYEQLFSPGLQAAAPLEQVNALWSQTAPLGPWRSEQTLGEESDGAAYVLAGSDPNMKLVLSVEIEGGLFTDARLDPWADSPVSYDAAVAAVEGLGETSYLIAETTSGECVPVVDNGADDIIPLGSVFKLFVLGAVVDAVAEGTVAWDQPVEIRDDLDSYPSGTTQDVPAGTEMTVRELAELMISISDNTATDHLIDLVGRSAVEAAQSAYGVTQPELNQPFLKTRELFQIKLNAELRERYIPADEAERRLILDEVAELPLAPLDEVLPTWTGPIAVDTLEWFATPADVCRTLIALNADADAAAILQINPGIPDETSRWDTIGFKGGSEPGVLAMAWIVADGDVRSFAIVGAAVSDGLINDAAGAVAFGGLRDRFEAP